MSSMSNNVENLSPQIIRGVVREMQDLVANAPEGIKVQINDDDVTDIQAHIDGPAGTPYMSGVFRVKLTLGKDFPQSPPKAYFLTRIFHPNVAANGEICVNTLKKDWKPDLGIKHILLTIKCLLIVPNAESALNAEAGKMLLEHYDDYSRRAKMMTEIHAQKASAAKSSSSSSSSDGANRACCCDPLAHTGPPHAHDGPLPKKHAADKKLTAEKKKILKDKKRTLKRL